MNKEEIFSAAKEAIFGPYPSDPELRIAYNMAETCIGGTIRDAESSYVGFKMPDDVLVGSLKQAFLFHTDAAFQYFSDKTKNTLKTYAENLQDRYTPLLRELKAA